MLLKAVSFIALSTLVLAGEAAFARKERPLRACIFHLTYPNNANQRNYQLEVQFAQEGVQLTLDSNRADVILQVTHTPNVYDIYSTSRYVTVIAFNRHGLSVASATKQLADPYTPYRGVPRQITFRLRNQQLGCEADG